MKVKATLFVVLLALFVVENGDAWRWVKKIVRGVKRAWHGAKRVWHRYGWIRTAVHHGVKWLGDVEKMRQMDDESYETFMARLEEDIADDFDDEQARDFLNGLDEIRKLSDEEFKKLEDLSNDYGPSETRDADEAEVLKEFVRRLSHSDEE